MSRLIEGKTVLVTGGSTGLGKASSLVMAREGARVIIADLQDDRGNETVAEIQKAGGAAEYHHLDVTDYDGVRKLIHGIVERYGSLDGALNNAGVEGPPDKVHKLDLRDWERVVRIDLTSVFICAKCEIEAMLQKGTRGSIVNTASVAGLSGLYPGASSYVAAKHGVIGFSKALAIEYARKNIRVNAICPGFINTPMLTRLTAAGDHISNVIKTTVPIGRPGDPSEIGEAVTWLMSERASYITGIALPIDGGWTAS